MVEGKVTVDGVLGGQPDGVVSRYLREQLPEKGMNCILYILGKKIIEIFNIILQTLQRCFSSHITVLVILI